MNLFVTHSKELHGANLFSTGVNMVLWFYGDGMKSNKSGLCMGIDAKAVSCCCLIFPLNCLARWMYHMLTADMKARILCLSGTSIGLLNESDKFLHGWTDDEMWVHLYGTQIK